MNKFRNVIAFNEYVNRNGKTTIIKKVINNHFRDKEIDVDEFLMLDGSIMDILEKDIFDRYYNEVLKSSFKVYSLALKYGYKNPEMLNNLTNRILELNEEVYIFLFLTQVKNLTKEQRNKLSQKIIEIRKLNENIESNNEIKK